jgi:hypothetical protein
MDTRFGGFPWDELGIDATTDVRAVKSAYAKKLRLTRPDVDAEGYQRLRTAYEFAILLAQDVAHEKLVPVREDGLMAAALPEGDVPENVLASNADLFEATISVPAEPATDSDAQMERVSQPLLSAEDALAIFKANYKEFEQKSPGMIREELGRVLDALPLDEKFSASRLFAQWVLSQGYMRAALPAALDEYFAWRRDYRMKRVLGYGLAEELHGRLDWLLSNSEDRGTESERGALWDEICSIADAVARGRKRLAFRLSLLAMHQTRDVLKGARDLGHSGIPADILHASLQAVLGGNMIRTLILISLVLTCMLLLSPHNGPAIVAMALGTAVIALIAVETLLHVRPFCMLVFGRAAKHFLGLSRLGELDQNRWFLLVPIALAVTTIVALRLAPADAPTPPSVLQWLALSALLTSLGSLLVSEVFSIHLMVGLVSLLFASGSSYFNDRIGSVEMLAIVTAMVTAARAELMLRNEDGSVQGLAYVARVAALITMLFAVPGLGTTSKVFLLIVGYLALSAAMRFLMTVDLRTTYAIFWAPSALVAVDVVPMSYLWLALSTSIAAGWVVLWLRKEFRADLLRKAR